MTLMNTVDELSCYINAELNTTASEIENVVSDIVALSSDGNVPLDELVEVKHHLQDIYEDIQSLGTTLESYQVRLEEVRNRLVQHTYRGEEEMENE